MSKIHREKNDLYFKYLELEYYTHQIIESKKKKIYFMFPNKTNSKNALELALGTTSILK